MVRLYISEHAKIAIEEGVSKVLKIKNGYLVDISNEGKVIKEIENGKVALNGNELILTDSNFLRKEKNVI